MTMEQVQERAMRLGLSAWVRQAIAASDQGHEGALELKCVGFASADFALAEGETWKQVFDEATRIIFGA